MALRADEQGFLVGTPVDIGNAVKLWRSIREDVGAIRRAVLGVKGEARSAADKITRTLQEGARAQERRESGKRAAPVAVARRRSEEGASARERRSGETGKPARKNTQTLKPSNEGGAKRPLTPARRRGAADADTRPPAKQTPAKSNTPNKPGATTKETAPATPELSTEAGQRKAPKVAPAITPAPAKPAVPARPRKARTPPELPAKAVRDGRGRFVKGGGGEGGYSDDDDNGRRKSSTLVDIKELAERLTGAVKESTADLQEADPTVQAFEEIAQPLQRGFGALFGGHGDPAQERWYRRFWKWFNTSRDEEKKAEKKQQKSLDEINAKTGLAGGSSGGMNLSLGGGPGGLFSGLLGKGKGLLGKLGKLGRRLPIIGGLLAVLGAGSDAMDAENDPGLTRREKDRGIGAAAGGGIGVILGGVLGSFLGPLGTVGGAMAGAYIGDLIGERVGLWVNDLRAADIPGKIGAVWDDFAETIGGFVKQGTGYLTETFGKVSKTIEKWTGIDVEGLVDEATTKLSAVGDMLGEWLSEKLGKSWEDVKASARNIVAAATEAAGAAVDTVRDFGTKALSYATGSQADNKEAMVSQMDRMGMTDPEERAMFMAQAHHESGGFTSMEESMKYSPEKLAEVAGESIDRARTAIALGPKGVGELLYGGRKDLGNVNPGDGYLYRGRGQMMLTGRANYTAAGKALGLDLVNQPELAADPKNGAAIAAWYWKNRGLSAPAQAGNVDTVTEKINGGQNGLEERRALYQEYLSAPIAPSPLPPAMATIPAPRAQTVAPMAPTPPEAPAVPVPFADAGNRTPTPVVINPQDAGQDIKERGIALIVTGGLSSA